MVLNYCVLKRIWIGNMPEMKWVGLTERMENGKHVMN